MTTEQLFREIPKAENHYHLDAVSAENMWKFAQRNHIDLPYKSLDEVKKLYQYETLTEFIDVYLVAVSTVRTEDDFADMVLECAADMKAQNIVYREAMFDYVSCFACQGIAWDVMAAGLVKGLQQAKAQYGSDIRFIANLDRCADVQANLDFLKEMLPWLDRLPVIAVGLDNAEIGYPAHNQAEAFAFAKEHGLFLTAHAGEDCGAESVRDALDSLKLDRIDHGLRAVEDPELVKELAASGILLTLCPESNLTLGAWDKWETYPVKQLMDAGVNVSISSDDPPYFKMDMAGNLIKLTECCGVSVKEAIGLVRNGFACNFAGQEHLAEFDRWVEEHAG